MMNPASGEGDTAHQHDAGVDFHHPYTPYDVQFEFMKTVYDVLEIGQGQVGILESPTGTVGRSQTVAFCSASLSREHVFC